MLGSYLPCEEITKQTFGALVFKKKHISFKTDNLQQLEVKLYIIPLLCNERVFLLCEISNVASAWKPWWTSCHSQLQGTNGVYHHCVSSCVMLEFRVQKTPCHSLPFHIDVSCFLLGVFFHEPLTYVQWETSYHSLQMSTCEYLSWSGPFGVILSCKQWWNISHIPLEGTVICKL